MISHTKSRWDTCFNGTLAFSDYKRSEVGGEPAINARNRAFTRFRLISVIGDCRSQGRERKLSWMSGTDSDRP